MVCACVGEGLWKHQMWWVDQAALAPGAGSSVGPAMCRKGMALDILVDTPAEKAEICS